MALGILYTINSLKIIFANSIFCYRVHLSANKIFQIFCRYPESLAQMHGKAGNITEAWLQRAIKKLSATLIQK